MGQFDVTASRVWSGRGDQAWRGLQTWAWSDRTTYGLRRDLSIAHLRPGRCDIDMQAVPLDGRLATLLFDANRVGGEEGRRLARRRALWEAGSGGGWVVVDPDGRPVYLQWLLSHNRRCRLKRHGGWSEPPVGTDELLVEGSWVPPAFRGRKVIGDGVHLCTEAARAGSMLPVEAAVAYLHAGNLSGLVGFHDAGYRVFERRTERWRAGRRVVTVEAVGDDDVPVLARRLAGRA